MSEKAPTLKNINRLLVKSNFYKNSKIELKSKYLRELQKDIPVKC